MTGSSFFIGCDIEGAEGIAYDATIPTKITITKSRIGTASAAINIGDEY